METTLHVLTLLAFAGGFLVVGAVIGVTLYHFGLGWFISQTSKEHLEAAVESAEQHMTRRAERRHGRERRQRILAENGHGRPAGAGRHLAR